MKNIRYTETFPILRFLIYGKVEDESLKNKVWIIIGIVIIVLFVIGLITGIKDSARVQVGIEPKYVIKTVSYHGDKVTYFGLGYKIVRHINVNPNEPYSSNRGVDFYSLFSNYGIRDKGTNENEENNTSINNKESTAITIREDVCELYLEVLEDLWNVDPGLNSEISQIGIDLSKLSHLTETEKDTVMREFASKHDLPYIVGTCEELCEQGFIDKENLYWKDGLFFSIKTSEDVEWNLPNIKESVASPELTSFDAQKWRSGLGAYYFGKCTAQKNADGIWSYTVGEAAIS